MTIIILLGFIITLLVFILFFQALKIQKLKEKKEKGYHSINSLLDLYKGNYKEIKTKKEIYFFINNLIMNILQINKKDTIEKEIENVFKRLNITTYYSNKQDLFYFFIPQELQDFIETHYHAWFTQSEKILIFRQIIKPIIKPFFYPDEWCIYSTNLIQQFHDSEEVPEPAQNSLSS